MQTSKAFIMFILAIFEFFGGTVLFGCLMPTRVGLDEFFGVLFVIASLAVEAVLFAKQEKWLWNDGVCRRCQQKWRWGANYKGRVPVYVRDCKGRSLWFDFSEPPRES